jgi:hypothetical protein
VLPVLQGCAGRKCVMSAVSEQLEHNKQSQIKTQGFDL